MTAHSRGPINVDTCPFCGETDFDAIGLKGHLTQEDCEEYRSIVPPPRPFPTPRAATVEQAQQEPIKHMDVDESTISHAAWLAGSDTQKA